VPAGSGQPSPVPAPGLARLARGDSLLRRRDPPGQQSRLKNPGRILTDVTDLQPFRESSWRAQPTATHAAVSSLAQLRAASVQCTPSGAGWSSLAARRAHNPKVAGSNPAPATTKLCDSHAPTKGLAFASPFPFRPRLRPWLYPLGSRRERARSPLPMPAGGCHHTHANDVAERLPLATGALCCLPIDITSPLEPSKQPGPSAGGKALPWPVRPRAENSGNGSRPAAGR
jgi:hypothetical protein